ncbi:MAG: hypothetical protein HYV67_03285 [Candidatus Taylorbacteria bacterium]|nr:hypothetical protein [Candidatus Taylorbacteria bacterium]
MAKILVVTKDIAEFQIYQPVKELLRAAGHDVTVIAEGLSLDKWLEAGEAVYGGRPDEVHQDAQTKCRYDIEELKVLKELQPDLILTGLGAPINLGERFGLAANLRGIKLGYVIDVWGAESRSLAVPGFICTLDQFGKKKIETYGPYQNLNLPPRVYVTGSPAMDRLAHLQGDKYVSGVANVYGLVVLLAGQDESTTPVVEGLLEALGRLNAKGQRVMLISRLHPKFLARADLQALWLAALAKAPCDVLWVKSDIATARLIKSVQITVSTYSNALIEAAMLGSTPVSWVSDIGREKMRVALGGLERFPLVDYGCALEVSTAEEFLAIEPETRDKVAERCRQVFPNGKAAKRVVGAIKAELR